MLKKALFLMIVGSLLVVALSFAQEKITITTYYPSPYGSYRELRAQRMALGENFYGSAYCWEPDTCAYKIDNTPAAGVLNSGNTDLIVEGRLGIGGGSYLERQITIAGVGTGGSDITAIPVLDIKGGIQGVGRDMVALGHGPAIVLNKGDGLIANPGGASDIYFAAHGGIAAKEGMYFFTDAENDGNSISTRGFHFRKGGENIPLTTGNELMVIDYDGNVGIGVANPVRRLQVVGDGRNAAVFTNGNVGIGLVSPGQNSALHVKGRVRIQDGTEGKDKILYSDDIGQAQWRNLSYRILKTAAPFSSRRIKCPQGYIPTACTYTGPESRGCHPIYDTGNNPTGEFDCDAGGTCYLYCLQ
jgi:hypothetical protein